MSVVDASQPLEFVPSMRTPLLVGCNAETKRAEIKAYFQNSWAQYESLFTVIANDAAYYKKAEPLRHPLIFYFGHTATFYINKLKLGKYIEERVNENFESMFAIGVDEMSWDDLNDEHYDWPEVNAVRKYRNQVKETVESLIDDMEVKLPISQDSLAWAILMGVEHERIHLETSSVIIRQLPLSDVVTRDAWKACAEYGDAPANEFVPLDGGLVTLGKKKGDLTYGWDNEYGSEDHTVSDFRTSRFLVSNGEYLEFIRDGGYEKHDYWTVEGKKWLLFTEAKMPLFWKEADGGVYMQRNLTEEIPLPLNWPAEVNQLEAKAFCNWKAAKTERSIRLPTEAEYFIMRQGLEGDSVPADNCFDDKASPAWKTIPGNLALAHYASSCPVNKFQQGTHGLYDIVGNVWQHSETPFDGFSGFAVHPLYDDFSTPTFDGKHNLIKGGSWISTGNEAIRSSRYAFRRHFYQHAGFRYVESSQDPATTIKVNVYETDESVAQYLEFHYGQEYFNVPNFSVTGVNLALSLIDRSSRDGVFPDPTDSSSSCKSTLRKGKALDIGCSVGRSSLELGRHFEHVDGIDFSARFIQQAYALTENGQKRYTIRTEGDLVEYCSINLKDLGYDDIKDKVHFAQGDACNLKPLFTRYDLIYASNLIDRMGDPREFLSIVHERMNRGGYFVILSPYTWLEEYTDKSQWIGGIKVNGENHSTLDGLHDLLKDRFDLVSTAEVPFVIRETKRKFQHSISEMSVWHLRE